MNAVAIDVDMLDTMPAKSMLQLVERTQAAKKYAAMFHQTLTTHTGLFRRLEELDIDIRFDLRDGDIAVSFTGDGERLKEVWAEFRRNGFEPSSRPEKGATGHLCFWSKPDFAKFFMSFSSSMCRRVQVGTKMVEQPVYETVCGELPEIEAPEQSLAVVDSDIPF